MKKKNNNGKQSYIFTKETFGLATMLFCFVIAVMLLTHRTVFGGLGGAICTFMYGTFGYGSYLLLGALGCLGFWLVFGKFPKLKLRLAAAISALVFVAFLLFHSVTTRNFSMDSYGHYLSQCYLNAQAGYSGYTFGGVISGLLVYPIARGATYIGAYVIFSLLIVACAYLTFLAVKKGMAGERSATVKVKAEDDSEDVPASEIESGEEEGVPYPAKQEREDIKGNAPRREAAYSDNSADNSVGEEERAQADKGRRILFEPGEFAAESYRRNLIFNEDSYFNHPIHSDEDYLRSFSDGRAHQTEDTPPASTYTSDYSDEVERSEADNSTPSYLYGDKPVENLTDDFANEDEPSNEGYDSYTVKGGSPDYSQTEDDAQGSANYDDVPAREDNPDIVPRRALDSDFEDFMAQSGRVTPREQDNALPERNSIPDRSALPERNSIPERRSEDIYNLFGEDNSHSSEENSERGEDKTPFDGARRSSGRESVFDDDGDDGDNLFGDENSLTGDRLNEDKPIPASRDRSLGDIGFTSREAGRGEAVPPRRPIAPAISGEEKAEEKKPEPAPEKPKHVWKRYVRPTLDLLDDYPENNNINTAEIEESKNIICETLNNFRIASQVSNVVVGPAITRYDVVIEDKTNIKNALKYREAIAMALMKDNVNAYLNYSKGAISIEVPNSKRAVVGLKSMLASSQFINCKPNTLTFALGKNVEGQVVCPDITKMPHLLVAGTTGSGKSICLSALIVSLLYKYGPEELRFILVDPKQVEFISYDKLPHLMINEIIYDVDKAIKALNWAIKEMEDRYAKFKEMTERGIATKNLTEYNAHLPEGEEKLPKIVIILDEFGDLMLQAKKEIESRIIRLVQKARACGIHLILATQRPSVDCITGLIKSNLPTRIGFKVNSFDDARCIFDIGGAEKLLGKGDLYYRSAENPELARVQGCFIDTHEVQKVTDFVKENNETYFDQTVSDFINTVEEPEDTGADDTPAGGGETKIDDTFIKALSFCVTSNQASVSMIQRRFPIGYMKACKIIDWMENMNYITQSEGSKPRKVLLSREEFIRIFGNVDE